MFNIVYNYVCFKSSNCVGNACTTGTEHLDYQALAALLPHIPIEKIIFFPCLLSCPVYSILLRMKARAKRARCPSQNRLQLDPSAKEKGVQSTNTERGFSKLKLLAICSLSNQQMYYLLKKKQKCLRYIYGLAWITIDLRLCLRAQFLLIAVDTVVLRELFPSQSRVMFRQETRQHFP